MNKDNIPFVFAFVFLIALSLVLPTIANINASHATNQPVQATNQIDAGQTQSSEDRFIESANSFYAQLCELDNTGLFVSFYNENVIKSNLLASPSDSLLDETTELFNSAKERVVIFKQNNPTQLYYEKLVEDNNTNDILDSLYSKLTQCFGL